MIKTEEAYLNIEAASHPGLAGKQNEDRYGVSTFMVGSENQTPSVLAVLCDGIGGHRAGEVAAEMGVRLITDTITNSDASQPLKVMEKAITRASAAIRKASETDRGRKGMGATVAVAWVIDNRLYSANLGDTRIYLLREDHFIQLTTDHTWVQEALDAGVITENDRESHPNAHVIRRYLGAEKAHKPDFRLWFFADEDDQDALDNQGLQLEPGDILLLCSDGLTDLVSDEELHAVLMATPQDEIPQALIEMANERGGHDNTTVVLLGVPPGAGGVFSAFTKRGWLVGCLASFALVAIIVTAVFLGLRGRDGVLRNRVNPTPAVIATFQPETQPVFTDRTPTPTMTPTDTGEPSMDVDSPRATLTPWPTHTSEP